jgi:error-prone DNA polymerase
MSSYVPLWCKSNFSFLEGASHPDELVDEVYRLGLPALALTDRDGIYGVVRAHVKAREVGMKIIIGSEVTVADGSTIVLLAQDRNGYANLCRLVSKGRLRSEKGASAVSWDEVCAYAPGLIALWGGEISSVTPAKAGVQEGSSGSMGRTLDSLNSQTKCNTFWIRCCNGTML